MTFLILQIKKYIYIFNFNCVKSCNWIAATTELLTTTVNNLVKTNDKLRNATSELSNTLNDMTDKFQGNINDLKSDENWISKDVSIV